MADGHAQVSGRPVDIDVDGVRMNLGRMTRVVHASDAFGDTDQCFGGDTMGHWNVARINRILDACAMSVIAMPIPRENMLEMARVGKPDLGRARAYAAMGIASMPPLSFIAIPVGDGEVSCMMVDGHHRMMALHLLGVTTVMARLLPPELVDDVRIVEITEVAVFPAASLPKRSFSIDARPVEVAHV